MPAVAPTRTNRTPSPARSALWVAALLLLLTCALARTSPPFLHARAAADPEGSAPRRAVQLSGATGTPTATLPVETTATSTPTSTKAGNTTATFTSTPTATETGDATATITATPDPTGEETATFTPTSTSTRTPASTRTPSSTRTVTPTGTTTSTGTATASPTATPGCGLFWRESASPNLGQTNLLASVSAVSYSDIWAVGSYINTFSYSIAAHWNGTQWSSVPIANPLSKFNFLTGVAAVASDDVWAVGAHYPQSTFQPLVEHWDGSKWDIVPIPDTGASSSGLDAVTAISADDVWAVGSYSLVVNQPRTLVLHWDGTEWSHVPSPNPGLQRNVLLAVAAVAADDVWAVGYASDVEALPYKTLILHWDGTEWSHVPSPSPSVLQNFLNGVAGVSSNDVWAVGTFASGGRSRALTLHWDGASWTQVDNSGLTPLQAVTALSANDVWAVGNQLTMHWDGAAWQPVGTPGNYSLRGVAALSPYEVWAVGSAGPQTRVLRYTDLCGSPTPTATPCVLPFNDVPPSEPFYSAVNYLYCRQVVSGYADRTYRPYNYTTRAQTCKIIVLAQGWPIDPGRAPEFCDVPPSHPFYPYIATAYAHGIAAGYADCTFRPYADVTRGQVAKMAVLAGGWLIDTSGGPHFTDVPPTNPFYGWIETAYNRGIISGYADRTFRWGNPATRGQIAVIIYRALGAP